MENSGAIGHNRLTDGGRFYVPPYIKQTKDNQKYNLKNRIEKQTYADPVVLTQRR